MCVKAEKVNRSHRSDPLMRSPTLPHPTSAATSNRYSKYVHLNDNQAKTVVMHRQKKGRIQRSFGLYRQQNTFLQFLVTVFTSQIIMKESNRFFQVRTPDFSRLVLFFQKPLTLCISTVSRKDQRQLDG